MWFQRGDRRRGEHIPLTYAVFGGVVQPNDMQALAEKVPLSVFAQGHKAAAARGCISALKAVATLGWIPPLQWDRLWRLSKAAVDSPGQFGGPDLLPLMAESCTRVGKWTIYATAVLSLATLCRVGEISLLRRSNFSKVGITYQGIRCDHRQITRRLGPYAQAWASWLRRIAPGEALALGRAADLEIGMAKLLQGTDKGEARWHSWSYIPPLVGTAVETPPVVGQMAQHQNCTLVRVSPRRI